MITWTRKFLLLFVVMASVPVVLYQVFDLKWLQIPWQPLSLIGIAVSFYLGFKNNSSYERMWEARKIWGGIVNSSRSFTAMIRDFTTNDFADEAASDEALAAIKKSFVHRHIAWLNALTYQLREKRSWEHHGDAFDGLRKIADIHSDSNHFEKVKPYLSVEEYDYVGQKGNKASHILSLQSKGLAELRSKGHIDDFRHMELQKMVTEFYALQGKSERIKNFPFPRQYASVNFFFVWIFIGVLPFGMINVFSAIPFEHFIWITIPITVLVSWVFIVMELIGDYSENPFEGLHNDVPITSMARGIEIDIRQMLDETNLPAPIPPAGAAQVHI
jgi:putative membrane protein